MSQHASSHPASSTHYHASMGTSRGDEALQSGSESQSENFSQLFEPMLPSDMALGAHLSTYQRDFSYNNQQLQSWNTSRRETCVEPASTRPQGHPLGNHQLTSKNHPWRPTMGYENVEVRPLPGLPVTNQVVEGCAGLSTEPVRFPNLVTGFERDPVGATRAAMYTRYTPYEWTQHNIHHFNESDANRNYSERVRADACRIIRETDELTSTAQREVGRRLGERLSDLTFWKNELAAELEKMIQETSLLNDSRRLIEKGLKDLEAPLHIAQECLYHRENRTGMDMVHDQVEQTLLREVETLRKCQDELRGLLHRVQAQVSNKKDLVHDDVEQCLCAELGLLTNGRKTLKALHDRTIQQLGNNRAAQHELERDLKLKEQAMNIDNTAHSLNNFSRGINYYGGIEKYDNTVSSPEAWSDNSNKNIERSQSERARSSQLRTDTDNFINVHANDCWCAWTATNSAFERRSNEIMDARQRLQMHLHKVQREIFDAEKNIEQLRKSINDKSMPLKVAQTRLESRGHRTEIELCRDHAQIRLIQEIHDLQEVIDKLHRKLIEAEAQHQQLLKNRSNLEQELAVKMNSLFIDREKCMGIRRSYPISTNVKY